MHERLEASPRVVRLCETYKEVIECCSKGLRRAKGGDELANLSEKIRERQKSLLSLIAGQMDKQAASGKEVE